MTTLRIKVTEEIIRKSRFCAPSSEMFPGYNCAIALAVREIFPYAWVGTSNIKVYEKELDILGMYDLPVPIPIGSMNLPVEAKTFIINFDVSSPEQRLNLDELEFEIEIPDEIIARINIDEIRKLLKNSSTLELKEV
jgi:hypothetical protein